MEEKDAYYVVRKGDIIGVYKSLTDCQHLGASSSVCNPSMSVYKGYSLPKEAEEYLDSNGLKNATYTIRACDVTDGLFGELVACPLQVCNPSMIVYEGADEVEDDFYSLSALAEIDSLIARFAAFPVQPGFKETSDEDSPQKSVLNILERGTYETGNSVEDFHLFKLDNSVEAQPNSSNCDSCILQFDGASKGNPGQSGAGAVLRAKDGSIVCRLREGVGFATNNVAEYRAVILGLKYALKKGFKNICVQGDSKLVCMQIPGIWKTKNQKMADLCEVARELKDQFVSFKIDHVVREFNSEADAQANLAIYLKDGEVQEECNMK